MSEAYPLAWPLGWPRTEQPKRSALSATFVSARDGIVKQLRLMKATNVVISSNTELRQDGLPYSGRRQPDDKGVAVYFLLNGEEQCIPCDRWNKIEHNLRAIEKTIDALRGLERWGAKEMVDAAFRGFKALPSNPSEHWTDVLGLPEDASQEDVKDVYRSRVKILHPDMGGDPEEFQKLQRAYQEATA